ncbi:MAG: 2-succinyl-5-enolpyruvyl-6-hydroxy-3-cyclohexene-1-carboxylic-acid synthase [Verrucomicrobia bacterium]|nr:2-succinyl-5-enolpyruvyl-6-hydroxy-3-cyclohexene-1-carboxylic-acid synthase [Verrucomicrobiota bacterium]
MQNGQLTTEWGKTIVDQLVQQGVTYFCLSPGSRSTPLTMAVAENPDVTSFVHFDERGSAFHALGYAKASGKPAAVIVTSGTALGNLLPAIMEAKYAHVPLIILTSDRPAELRDVMANQTCDQIKIFADSVNYFFDLPTPTTKLPEQFLATTIAQLVSQSTYPIKGPVQLNCPFAEPFFNEAPAQAKSLIAPSYTMPEVTLNESQIEKWSSTLGEIEKGVIILGANGSCKAVDLLAEKLGWPIFADINSSHRHLASPHVVPYYHHIIKSLPELKVDAVLHFGDALVSKFVMLWEAQQERVIHVAPHANRCDPLHCVTDRVICEPQFFCEKVSQSLENRKGWFDYSISPEIDTDILTEPSIFKELENHPTALFIANSMPIRDGEMFFFPKKPRGPIFANRGLSGIDGNIATCAGIAHHMPLIAVIGDQTFLHDLNSLAQLKKTKHPVKLIVVNNGGGGIFSFIAIGERKDLLDTYFAAAHQWQFEKAAELFGLPYCTPLTPAELGEALKTEDSCLIEIKTNRQENLALHKQIDNQVKNQLCSSFCTAS